LLILLHHPQNPPKDILKTAIKHTLTRVSVFGYREPVRNSSTPAPNFSALVPYSSALEPHCSALEPDLEIWARWAAVAGFNGSLLVGGNAGCAKGRRAVILLASRMAAAVAVAVATAVGDTGDSAKEFSQKDAQVKEA
jgi:hypothetical protein